MDSKIFLIEYFNTTVLFLLCYRKTEMCDGKIFKKNQPSASWTRVR